MTTSDENRLSMMFTTESVLDENTTIIATVPAIQAKVTSFKSNITDITTLDTLLSGNTTSGGSVKDTAKRNLAEVASTINVPLSAWLKDNGDPILAKQLRKTRTALLRLPDTGIINYVTLVTDTITPIAATLAANTTINAAAIAALTAATSAFNNVKSTPDLNIAKRKTKNAELRLAVKNNTALLKELDDLMLGFRLTNPTLFNDYTNARVIKNLGGKNPRIVKTIEPSTNEEFLFTNVANSSTFNIRLQGEAISVFGLDTQGNQGNSEIQLVNNGSTSRKASIFEVNGISGLFIKNGTSSPAIVTVSLIR